MNYWMNCCLHYAIDGPGTWPLPLSPRDYSIIFHSLISHFFCCLVGFWFSLRISVTIMPILYYITIARRYSVSTMISKEPVQLLLQVILPELNSIMIMIMIILILILILFWIAWFLLSYRWKLMNQRNICGPANPRKTSCSYQRSARKYLPYPMILSYILTLYVYIVVLLLLISYIYQIYTYQYICIYRW